MVNNLDFPIAVVQLRARGGNIRGTLREALEKIARARGCGAKIVVFPELIWEYMFGDRWEHDSFIREIEAANETIREASGDIVVVWGSVRADWARKGEDGRVRKYNAALIAHDGRWVSNGRLHGWIPKTNMPKYRIFDDERHFYPGAKLAAEMGLELADLLRAFDVIINGKKVRIALAVCEDLWEDEYNTKVAQIYQALQPDLLIDISQSPWTAEKWHARDEMLKRRVQDAGCPILYVNGVGLQNNAKNLVWFDGSSSFINEKGEFTWRAPQHEEGLFVMNPARESGPVREHTMGIAESHAATIGAMRDFYASYKRVIIGLSGGIDSAVSLAMHVEALGSGRVLAINMPTEFNSQTTRNLAKVCADNFGVEYVVVPIQKQYEVRLELLKQAGYSDPSAFDRGNIQARIRGQVLADISACEASRLSGRVGFSCNGNKTEVALNYFTLYGDGAGCSAFFADYWKGDMYALARYINERRWRFGIPQGIIDIVPSAELDKSQNVDEGKGDPIYYPYHDALLKTWAERRWTPENILDAFNHFKLREVLGDTAMSVVAVKFPTRQEFINDLEWAWKQYNYEGKRHMLPPGLIRTRRAFGFDRRDSIADAYLTDGYYKERQLFLAET